MPKRVLEKTIQGTRITKERIELEMKQNELAIAIEEMMGESTHLTVSMISAWESGRRAVPTKYNNTLCKLFNCSLAYLLGETNDKNCVLPTGHTNDADELYKISLRDIFDYDGMPIWVESKSYEFPSGWAIFNGKNGLFMFKDGARIIRREKDVCVYVKVPDYEQMSLKSKRGLDFTQLIRNEKVYIEMTSVDDGIRKLYNGWYYHNEDHTALIAADTGRVLPYNGLNISYRAYAAIRDRAMQYI